jgi:GNAT superfamily N-acetyltransferase
MGQISYRSALEEDHRWIVDVVDDWWGRPVARALPRLFLDHFHRTSFVVEEKGRPIAFLIGFLSASKGDEAYIHFVGVDPAFRRHGIGAALYERFFELARSDGRHRVKAITAAVNADSIAFHRELGFDVSPPIEGYDRPGAVHVVFTRELQRRNGWTPHTRLDHAGARVVSKPQREKA